MFLFILLFQHRTAISEIIPASKRLLFSPSVFLLIAIWLWVIVYYFADPLLWETLMVNPIRWSLFIWLFFFVGSYLVFRMDKQHHGWKHPFKRFLAVAFLAATLWLARLLLFMYTSWVFVYFVETWWREVHTIQPIQREMRTVEWESDEIASNDEILNWTENDAFIDLTELFEDPDEQWWENLTWEDTEETEVFPSRPMLYSDLLPWIVERYNIDTTARYTFTNLSSDAPLYSAFNIARAEWMVWSNIDPQRRVWCQNLMVILWLAEWWNVNMSVGVFERYWTVAQERWLTEFCPTRTQIATTDFFNTFD